MHRDTAGHGEVRLEREQALAGKVNIDETGGTGGVRIYGRAGETKLVCGARWDEILVVCDEQLYFAHTRHDICSGEQVVKEICAHPCPCEDSNPWGDPGLTPRQGWRTWRIPPRLHCVPGTFEKYTMLRIRDLRFSRWHAEEIRVETIHVGKCCRRRHVRWILP